MFNYVNIFDFYPSQVRIYKTCVGALINDKSEFFDFKIDLLDKYDEKAIYIYL